MVELPASLHDDYSELLHGLVENGGSYGNNPALEKYINQPKIAINYWDIFRKGTQDLKIEFEIYES
ncbi:hypothetical protein [Paenibacillus plantiphilus]|uniref:hypothetical protein n=1 Tax=Paenibacillus plantiphilus TaxID=2905650 RepID=UPI001F3B39AB|nr:hypothetical protein [Paenibacillus plantiphilus]